MDTEASAVRGEVRQGRYGSPVTLTSRGVGPELLSLAFPILGSIALQLVEASVNAMWVGRYLGAEALTAVSNANTVLILLLASAFGVWMAVTIGIGHHLGAGRIRDARALVRTGVWVFGGAGLALAVFLEILARPLLMWLSVPAESLRDSEGYLHVILLSVPLAYLSGMIFAALRGAGEARPAFSFSLVAAVLDAGLNPLFIFGLGPIAPGGVPGSAWATVLAQACSLTSLLLFLYCQDHSLCLRKGEFAMYASDWTVAGQLLKQGGPMGAEYLWYSILAILMISLVNRFGAQITAAYGAIIQLWNYVMMPSMALSLAATSMVARALGAGRWDQVYAITRRSLGYSLLATGITLLLLEGTGRSIFVLFLPTNSPALITASQINREASWFCLFFAGWAALMATPRATGAVWGPLILSAIAVGSRFPIAEALLSRFAEQGIWWSYPVSGAITAVATAIYYRLGKWRHEL